MDRIPQYLAAMALAGAGALSNAQVYEWRDSDGNVYYSDQPPQDVQAEEKPVDTSNGLRFADPAAVEAQRQRLLNWEQKEAREAAAARRRAELQRERKAAEAAEAEREQAARDAAVAKRAAMLAAKRKREEAREKKKKKKD